MPTSVDKWRWRRYGLRHNVRQLLTLGEFWLLVSFLHACPPVVPQAGKVSSATRICQPGSSVAWPTSTSSAASQKPDAIKSPITIANTISRILRALNRAPGNMSDKDKKARHRENSDGLPSDRKLGVTEPDQPQSAGLLIVPGWSGPRHSGKRGPTKIWVFGQRPPAEDGCLWSNKR